MVAARGIIKGFEWKAARMMLSTRLICRWILLALASLLTACTTLPYGSGLPAPLATSLAQAGMPASAVALDIRTVEGRSLALHNHQAAFNPASVMKLVTTAAALELLGPNHHWMTRVHTQGHVVGDVLEGRSEEHTSELQSH